MLERFCLIFFFNMDETGVAVMIIEHCGPSSMISSLPKVEMSLLGAMDSIDALLDFFVNTNPFIDLEESFIMIGWSSSFLWLMIEARSNFVDVGDTGKSMLFNNWKTGSLMSLTLLLL